MDSAKLGMRSQALTAYQHSFDVVAERPEAAADKPVAMQDASPDYWKIRSTADESVVGDYPQAEPRDPKEGFDWGESEELGPDGFPAVPIPEQKLRARPRRTEVLKATLWSEGQLFRERALAVFKQCNLGAPRECPVIVRDKKRGAHSLTRLHTRNLIPPTAIDFGRSEFYLADRLGMPKGPLAIDSFEDWSEQQRRASAGELDGCQRFSRIAYKKLFFRRGQTPSVDHFTLERL